MKEFKFNLETEYAGEARIRMRKKVDSAYPAILAFVESEISRGLPQAQENRRLLEILTRLNSK